MKPSVQNRVAAYPEQVFPVPSAPLCVPSSEILHLLGVRFHNLSTAEAAGRIEQFIREGRPRMILARNAAIRVLEEQDAWFREVYANCDLVTVDGMALVYLGRLLGRPFKEMTGGPALWYEMLRRAAENGYGVYLLGASDTVLQAALIRLPLLYPGLRLVGHHHGYFREETEDEEEVVTAIRAAHPEILMVGISSPMKERFLERNLGRLEVPACIGIGGAIDLFAGSSRLSPRWMRVLCLEWVYRIWQEPRRLLLRYLVGNTRFLWLVMRHLPGITAPAMEKARPPWEGNS
jgi:N-acetylglucosaminyldiphosphoundecaprenol N-acetyl-beta-D-mannosaminyltransferase